MKLPRDLSGQELVRLLKHYGYEETHRAGSHMRLTTREHGEHHITVPAHDHLRVGTLGYILDSVAHHLGLNRQDLTRELFGAW
ncbi:type II toxin-antitoxin system HicA family toxin [candidate division WOR-3 bacterium]|nr:type II toxin-antitoxin system HicA family toxin [candidate division WOR-3 bacterium]